jgi:hypothetical protein
MDYRVENVSIKITSTNKVHTVELRDTDKKTESLKNLQTLFAATDIVP